jgi:hypothetical protein
MSLIIPLGAIPFDRFKDIRDSVAEQLRARAAQKLKINPNEVVIRDLVVGDKTNAADWVDLDVKTAVVTGQQHWAQDAADLTDNTLSSVLASGERIPDNKFVAIFGFVDLTPNPDLVKMRFKRGQEVLDVWYVEHVYAWKEVVGGVIEGAIFYDEKDPIDIQMEFKDGSVDKYVALLALIAEPSGETVTAPR